MGKLFYALGSLFSCWALVSNCLIFELNYYFMNLVEEKLTHLQIYSVILASAHPFNNFTRASPWFTFTASMQARKVPQRLFDSFIRYTSNLHLCSIFSTNGFNR